MIRTPTLPGGFVIFADDIRQEVNGKLTIVGTYGTELHVSGEPPFMLPQLCVYIVYRDDPQNLPEQLTLKILLVSSDETTELWQTTIPMRETMGDRPRPAPINKDRHAKLFASFMHSQRFVPFIISEDCAVSVRAYVGDDELRLGALRIRCNADEESSVQLNPGSNPG